MRKALTPVTYSETGLGLNETVSVFDSQDHYWLSLRSSQDQGVKRRGMKERGFSMVKRVWGDRV
jgi:hypothetical protein